MQGMVMGMNHVTTGLGALLGSAIYNGVALVTAVAGNIYRNVSRQWLGLKPLLQDRSQTTLSP